MAQMEHERVFVIDFSKLKRELERTTTPNLSGAKEVGYFSRIDGECIAGTRTALVEFTQSCIDSSLNATDKISYQSHNRPRKSWSYLEPHRLCSVNVQNYDFVSKRGVMKDLALALHRSEESFEIHAVRLGPGEPVFLKHRKYYPSNEFNSRARPPVLRYYYKTKSLYSLNPLTPDDLSHY